MTAAKRVCGKLTKKGTACRRELHWWTEGCKARYADGCWRHMGEAFQEACAARKEAEDREWLAFLYADPICWGWPMPDLQTLTEVSEDKATELLSLWQNGRCAICGHPHDSIEDHDHTTGMVRGYLCRGCNIQEGIYRDPDCLFGKYREQHPTKMLGFRVRYWGPFADVYGSQISEAAEADKWADAASKDIGL
ncbi:endonuclease domain-containing protein [Streptomyces sp. NPDC006872]|uniref:endonuclease domain-containing protein n=1 Tax=Streptomyces sp. NPDC006872 TaxID=3155720 RepID=UPI0033C30503